MSSKAFTKKVFDWLHQVNRDERVNLKIDVAVCLELTDYFNEDDKDGRAWPSCKTIGDAINVHEVSVLRSMRRLEATGHLYVVWGKQGKGHTNQYWMILKPAPTQLIKPAPTQVKKPASKFAKPAPTQENHLKNQKMGGNAPTRGGARDPQEAQAGAEIPDNQVGAAVSINEASAASAFAAFAQVYPKKTGLGAARAAFIEACSIADPNYIVARAALYAKDYEGERARYAIPPQQWLEKSCFNDPLPDGVTIEINNNTGEVELVQPRQPQRNGYRNPLYEQMERLKAKHH
jgi:hypothetical protein